MYFYKNDAKCNCMAGKKYLCPLVGVIKSILHTMFIHKGKVTDAMNWDCKIAVLHLQCICICNIYIISMLCINCGISQFF